MECDGLYNLDIAELERMALVDHRHLYVNTALRVFWDETMPLVRIAIALILWFLFMFIKLVHSNYASDWEWTFGI